MSRRMATGTMTDWKLLALWLCLIDFTDISTSFVADKRSSANDVILASRATKSAVPAVDQDLGVRRRARLATDSILGGGSGSESGTGTGGHLAERRGKTSRIDFGLGGILENVIGGNIGSPGNLNTNSQSDSSYLVVKADLVSTNLANVSDLIQPLLSEVEQLLATGFSKETFQLTWLTYEQ